jgi:amino acid transporter
VNRTQLSGAAYALFGTGLVVDGAVDLRGSFAVLPALTALFGIGILVAGVVTLAGSDATPLDGRLAVGERPTWVIALLALAGTLLLAGAALRLLVA